MRKKSNSVEIQIPWLGSEVRSQIQQLRSKFRGPYNTVGPTDHICEIGAPNPSHINFRPSYRVPFYNSSASKCSLQNQVFLMKVILQKCEKRTVQNIRVIKILSNHYLIIVQCCWTIKGHILYQIKQIASKSGY